MAGKTRVGQFLKSKGASQNEAAEAIGISYVTFSNKAKGHSQFRADEIKAFADAYQMDAQEIKDVFL